MNNTTDEECFQDYNKNVYQVIDEKTRRYLHVEICYLNHKLYKHTAMVFTRFLHHVASSSHVSFLNILKVTPK